jgi:hypothetical protein
MPTYIRDAGAWLSVSGDSGIPSGTLMLFQQTTAPTGWTKQTTHNDKALRVVSGSASSGGVDTFSAVMNGSVGATTLTTAQIPSHTHAYSMRLSSGGGGDTSDTNAGGLARSVGVYNGAQNSTSAVNTGGGGSHTHTMNVAYVDLIIASKD